MARKFKTPITIDELGSASSQALAANVDGDSQNRINIDAGGKITWGSGSATGDTTLYRSAADTLKTDDAFTATSLAVTGQFTFPTSDGSADQVITTNGSGTLTWSDVSANATVSDTAPSSPATGQIWYESDTGKTFVYYDSFWIEVGASPPASPFITDLDEDTKIQVEESSDEDKIRFDTAGSERMIIDASGNVGIGTSSPSTTLEVDGVLTANHIHGNLAGAVYLHVKNTSGVTIPSGSAVYATGSVGASGETEVAISDADVSSTMPALGVIDTELVNNANGHAIVLGVATGLDTSGFAINDKLYVSTSGGLTNVRPTGASELVQKIARVIRSDASTGIILVGAGSDDDVPNIIVAGGLTIDTDTLHVDSTNDRVGIGTTSPVAGVDIASNGGATWTTNGWDSGLMLNSGSALRWRTGTALDWGMGATGDSFYVMSSTDSGTGSNADYRMVIDSSGHTFISNSMQTGQVSFTREPWAASTIALGNYGYVGTAGSFGTSLMWNWERGTDSGYYSLGVNTYTSAAAIHLRNDGIRFQYESSWGATSEPSVHTLMSATEILTYKDLRLYEGNPVITLQDSTNTGAHNGEILFKDQSATILGSVRMNGNDDLSVRAETSTSVLFYWVQGNWRFYMTSSQFLPYADNVYDLGATSKRFDDVYATNGTIQTSDLRDKTDIVDIDYGLDFVNSLRPVTYRWNDRSGYVGTRTHMGFVAQEVSTTLGDDAAGRALWVDSPAGEYKNADTGEYEPGVERQSLRYEEMIAPMVKAIQELTAQNEALTARIEALEAG